MTANDLLLGLLWTFLFRLTNSDVHLVSGHSRHWNQLSLPSTSLIAKLLSSRSCISTRRQTNLTGANIKVRWAELVNLQTKGRSFSIHDTVKQAFLSQLHLLTLRVLSSPLQGKLHATFTL
jgi:hypothetical protein